MYDDDPWAEVEALENERLEADLEMAELERAARAAEASRRAGRCPHLGWMAYRNPAVYPEQRRLKPGQVVCTDGCGRVFHSDRELLAEQAERCGY